MKPEMETLQTPWELDQLLHLYEQINPRNVLEIGAWEGGTLWHWLQTAEKVVVVDDAMRHAPQWQQWAGTTGCWLELFEGCSWEPAIIEAVRREGPYEWVFVDGDHTTGPPLDWQNYRPMVASGGVMVFHDISPNPSPLNGVTRVWESIKAEPGTRWTEIVQTPVPSDDGGAWRGLGCVFL